MINISQKLHENIKSKSNNNKNGFMQKNISNNYLLHWYILLEYSEANNISNAQYFHLLNVTLVHYNVILSLHQVRIWHLMSRRYSDRITNERVKTFSRQHMPHSAWQKLKSPDTCCITIALKEMACSVFLHSDISDLDVTWSDNGYSRQQSVAIPY